MSMDAYVHHHIPGRLRIRVPDAKGEEQLMRELSEAIASASGVSQVDYNPITGSILIQYSAEEHANLDSLHAGLNASAVPIAVKQVRRTEHLPREGRRQSDRRSSAAIGVDSFFTKLDNEIRAATDNEFDLKFIMPFAVGIAGLIALRYSSTTPLWLTLIIFAFHSFLNLHGPTALEMDAVEGLAVELATEG